jgi:hypothetical protein
MVLRCPDSRQYILHRDAAIALGVMLLSVASKMYPPPNGGAFREAVRLAFSVIDNPPEAEENDMRTEMTGFWYEYGRSKHILEGPTEWNWR